MNDFKLFFSFGHESFLEFWSEFKTYRKSFFSLLLLGMISCIPWQNLGFGENSLPEIVTSIVLALLSLVFVVDIILIEKKSFTGRSKEKLLYSAPTYLIYTFYSSLIFFIPTLLIFAISNSWLMAIIPAIFFGLCVVMVPVCSVCIDNDDINYFKSSFKLVKKRPVLIFLFFIFTILLEVTPFSFDLFSFSYLKLSLSLLYSLIETFLLISLTKVSVKIFYLS